ncbi:MAG: vWA domain-containing protein [Polyangiaceae bacterium]
MPSLRCLATSLTLCIVPLACSESGTAGAGGDGSGGATTSGAGGATSTSFATSGSGGRTDVGIDVGTSGRGGANGGESSCGIESYDRESKPAQIILVLDRSGSMEDPPSGGSIPKWEMTLPPLRSVVTATDATIEWGLKLYPELDETKSCAPESIVPLIHVPIAPNNAATVVAKMDAASPKGDGTPTGDAVKFATAHLDELGKSTDNPKFILLATDGDPSCPSSDASGYAVDAITTALDKGYPTFVIGVDTTKSTSIKRLNAMAKAGGRPRTVTNPEEEPLFYLASTQTELENALRAITTSVASCVFESSPPPPVPENIAVDFGGKRAERDPSRTNGWEYTREDHSQLEVYGQWCERIQGEAKNHVQIRYGCPNEDIPLVLQ